MSVLKVAILLVLLVAVVSAQGNGHHGEDYHAHPSFKFENGVHDSHTKINKQHSEHRPGHHTDSEYKVQEADGKNTSHVKQPIHGHHG